MKAEIHPHYVDCTIVCACGEVVHTRSTRAADPRRDLLEMPSVLHWQAETRRYSRARGKIPEEIRSESKHSQN